MAAQHGQRQYHSEQHSAYALPNDKPEHVRLNNQAAVLRKLLDDKILHCPVSSSASLKILDVGCGTGVVCAWLAEDFPHAHVSGLDFSPVPMTEHSPRISFHEGNVLTGDPRTWTADGKFDIVFSRLLIAGMNDWPGYAKKTFDMLESGGWWEVQDTEFNWWVDEEEVSKDWQWLKLLREKHEAKGCDYVAGGNARGLMERLGFVDVQQTVYKLPFFQQGWTTEKELACARYMEKHMDEVYTSIIDYTLKNEGATPAEIEAVQQDRRETMRPRDRLYHKLVVTYGRKP